MPNKQAFPFTIGADPEFNIVMQDMRVSANQLIPILFKGDKNAKAGNMGFNIGKAGNIGHDGASATGEIRPAPSDTPEEVVKNIGTLFSSFAKKTQLFELKTTSEKAPVGGHIHFSIPEDIATNSAKRNNIMKKLASYMLPLILGDDDVNLRTRISTGYGKLLDNHTNSFGDSSNVIYTMEVRSPSAEWMTTPKIAEATLAYMATVFHEIQEHPKNVTRNNSNIITNAATADALQKLTVEKFGFVLNSMIKEIKDSVKTFEYYEHYKEEIDYILSPKRVLRDKQRANFDIIRGWGLEGEVKKPTKRDLVNEKYIKERSKEIDLDNLQNLVSINHNPDHNVELFARAVKQRVLALNWKLNNIYFLYGLKKGINGHIVRNCQGEWLEGHQLVEDKRDYQCLNGTHDRMRRKVALRGSADKLRKNVMIGIPYDKRCDGNYRELIELIYGIERGQFEPITDEVFKRSLPDYLLDGEFGAVYKAYNSTEDINPMDAVVPDDSSHMSRVQEAMRSLESEMSGIDDDDEDEMPFKSNVKKVCAE